MKFLILGGCLVFLSVSCTKTDTGNNNQPITPIVQEESLKFTSNIDSVNYIVGDSLSLNFTISTKLPTNGISFSSILTWSDSSKVISRKDSILNQSGLNFSISGLNKTGTYILEVNMVSKNNSSNTATNVFTFYKRYSKNQYETQTSVNQKTGWYQTNRKFIGNFWIDSSSQVRTLFVSNSNQILFGDYIPDLQSYFSNRPTMFYTDLNNDGRLDVINNYWASPFGKDIPGYYAAWEYEKFGYKNPQVAKGLTAVRKFIFNDYFNNGKTGILMASSGSDLPPFPGDNIQIVNFNSDLSMNITDINETKGYYHTGASADIDNDGDIDILMYSGGNQSVGIGAAYFENTGGGKFKFSPDLITGIGFYKYNTVNYYTLELFDINKDGNIDILLGGSPGINMDSKILWGSVSHKFNTSNSTILPSKMSNGSSVMDIAFLDYDKDNDIDIVLLSEINYKGFGIELLENNNGNFTNVTSSKIDISNKPNTLWVSWVRIFDFDNDGDFDIVGDGFNYKNLETTPAGKQPVPKAYWINDGKGSFKGNFINID